VLAAKTLIDMGFENICHVAGGINAWKEAGNPVS
jgi:rhodanese-related sulfurtransferase